MKEIDLNKSVYEITEEFSEIIEVMVDLGFKDIKNPVIRRTAGRLMTIPQGCKMKGIDFNRVKEALEEKGYVTSNEQ